MVFTLLAPYSPIYYVGTKLTQIIISSLSPKRDWGSKRVKNTLIYVKILKYIVVFIFCFPPLLNK